MLIIVQVLKESHHVNWLTVNNLSWELAAYIVRCVVRSTRQQDDWYVNRKGPQSNIRRKINYLFIPQTLFAFNLSIMITPFTQLGKLQCVGIQGKWTHILRWQLSLYRDSVIAGKYVNTSQFSYWFLNEPNSVSYEKRGCFAGG